MDAEITIEDGEITDDSEDNYIPLPRPSNYSSSVIDPRYNTVQEPPDSDEDLESSSDSDSDSSLTKAKHPKVLKPKRKPLPVKDPSRKKYDIWSTHVQEDVLSETLINCDVSTVDRSRSVETYPLAPTPVVHNRTNNKRSNHLRKDPNLRLVGRPEEEISNVKGVSRVILDLNVTCDSKEDDIAKDIANKLYEEKEDLISKVIEVLGKDKAIQFFNETKDIEGNGGMLILNQTRRRTPGGVFLFLVKRHEDLTSEQASKIFENARLNTKKEIKLKKKAKLKQWKQKVAASLHNKDHQLPDLLSRADLCIKNFTEEKNRPRRASDDNVVKNPPPSPETDGDSRDEIDINKVASLAKQSIANIPGRNLQEYEDDFLDVSHGNDMDLF